jgi:hypothetical protein
MTRHTLAARPATSRRIPHTWRCSRPPAEDYLITGKDGRRQVIKRCPSCGGRDPTRPT